MANTTKATDSLKRAHEVLCRALLEAENAVAAAYNETHGDPVACEHVRPVLDAIGAGLTEASSHVNLLNHYARHLDTYRARHDS